MMTFFALPVKIPVNGSPLSSWDYSDRWHQESLRFAQRSLQPFLESVFWLRDVVSQGRFDRFGNRNSRVLYLLYKKKALFIMGYTIPFHILTWWRHRRTSRTVYKFGPFLRYFLRLRRYDWFWLLFRARWCEGGIVLWLQNGRQYVGDGDFVLS